MNECTSCHLIRIGRFHWISWNIKYFIHQIDKEQTNKLNLPTANGRKYGSYAWWWWKRDRTLITVPQNVHPFANLNMREQNYDLMPWAVKKEWTNWRRRWMTSMKKWKQFLLYRAYDKNTRCVHTKWIYDNNNNNTSADRLVVIIDFLW